MLYRNCTVLLRCLSITALSVLTSLTHSAFAQQSPTKFGAVSNKLYASNPPKNLKKKPVTAPAPVREPESVGRYLYGVSRLTDTILLVDRSVAREMVLPPMVPIRFDSVEQILNELVTTLPQGTFWLKAYLPSKGRDPLTYWNPDVVTDYLLLQSQLFGRTGTPPLVGSVEIMGNWVSGDTAHNLTESMRLRTVYVLVNPLRRDIVTGTSTVDTGNPSAPGGSPSSASPLPAPSPGDTEGKP